VQSMSHFGSKADPGKQAQDRRENPTAVRANRLSTTKPSLPRVEVRIGQRTFQAILDSGSSANFVSSRIFQVEEVTRQQLELASREATVETSGRIVATLHIGEACYENVLFLVVNELRDEVILQHQWLRDARATMDFTLGCVHHGARTRRTTYWNQRQPETIKTCRKEDEVRHGFPSSCAREFLDVLREFAGVMNDESVTGTLSAVSHTTY
jgi:hypothetical protein